MLYILPHWLNVRGNCSQLRSFLNVSHRVQTLEWPVRAFLYVLSWNVRVDSLWKPRPLRTRPSLYYIPASHSPSSCLLTFWTVTSFLYTLQIHKWLVRTYMYVYDVISCIIITTTCVQSDDWKDQCCLPVFLFSQSGERYHKQWRPGFTHNSSFQAVFSVDLLFELLASCSVIFPLILWK